MSGGRFLSGPPIPGSARRFAPTVGATIGETNVLNREGLDIAGTTHDCRADPPSSACVATLNSVLGFPATSVSLLLASSL